MARKKQDDRLGQEALCGGDLEDPLKDRLLVFSLQGLDVLDLSSLHLLSCPSVPMLQEN